jgi:NACalpha-BTF3-like transcription factor
MALPLPKVVADVGPGGPFVTSMMGTNALTQSNLENAIKRVQAQYAPLTTQAEAASKLAYANLMGPQFLAKMLGNSDIAANLSEDQLKNAIRTTYGAGSGQGTGNAMMNIPGMTAQFNQQQSNPLAMIANKIKSLIFRDQGQSQPKMQQFQQLQQSQQSLSPAQQFAQAYPEVANAMQKQYAQTGQAQYTIPGGQQQIPQSTYAERAGTYQGTKEELKQAGKIRADDIKELNDIVFNAETKQATYDDINNMISSPEIRQIRQVPLAGRHEMGWYAKFGTPEQQQLVGRLYAQMGNVIKDSSRDFAGQFRKGEQQLLQGMKPSDGDTVDSMIGKAESLSVMNKMLMERARLTSQYMSQGHINKLQASQMADKQVNGEQIRNHFHNKLNPKPLDKDIKFMAEKYKISEDEVKKRLKAKGLL